MKGEVMSKNQYIVTPRNEPAVVVVGLDIQCTGTAVTVMTDGAEVAAYFPDVVSVVKQEIVQGAEPAVIAVEAAKYSLGWGSAFLSASSPLVEAIESTARLIVDLESLADAGGAARLEVHGGLSAHLQSLLAQQLNSLRKCPGLINQNNSHLSN